MGANAPVGNLVDDYEMADGSLFDWNNPEHAANPYSNRDPRFHGTILHNGAKWRVRPDDAKGLDQRIEYKPDGKRYGIQLPTKLNSITG